MTPHIAFLGFCQTDADFEKILLRDRAMPVQTQRFGWSVVTSLEAAGGRVSILAAAPSSDWPGNKAVFPGGSRTTQTSPSARTHELLGFINVIGVKHVTRYVSARRALRRTLRDDPAGAIVVHGVHSAFLHAALRAGRAAGIPVIPILTDAPTSPFASGNPLVRWFRRFDNWLIMDALKRVDGVVALTGGLAEEYAEGRPALLLVGIAPAIPRAQDEPGSGPPRVIYAGGLMAEYGVGLLVEAVSLSRGEWILEVFGRGELQESIARASSTNDRVVYGGVLTPADLAAAYSTADLLVNPRPPDQELVSYSFPSKLLEYMATGKPVMSTHLPTIPADFDDHLLYAEADAASLAIAIDSFFARPAELRREFGHSTRDFIVEHYGLKAQGERMLRFVSELSSPTGQGARSR